MATFSFMAVMMAVCLAAVLLNDGSEAAPAERGNTHPMIQLKVF
jgi:hypothetical protein